jgi:hypothetical protein
MARSKLDRLLVRLGEPEGAVDFAETVFEFALDLPASRFVDRERLLAHVDAALNEQASERVIREHVLRFLDREEARARERGDLLGHWLTAEAKAEIRSLAARPVRIDKRFAEGIVRQEAVQHLLRSMVEETLDRFVAAVRRGADSGGVIGSVGRGALGIASRAGRKLVGDMGAQIEQHLSRAVKGFVESSLDALLVRLIHLITSEDMAVRMGRMSLVAVDEALKTPLADVLARRNRIDLDTLAEILPGVLRHNLERAEVRAGILEEVDAAMEVEGARTLRELLEEAGTLELWRADIQRLAPDLVAGFLASDGWKALVGRLL